MTDLIITITITDADAYVPEEEAAESIIDKLADVFEGPPAPMTVHMVIEDAYDKIPLAERRIAGWEE